MQKAKDTTRVPSPIKATVIVNPASRSGLKVYNKLREHIGGYFSYEVKFTEKRGHAGELARRAGSGVLIVCGGDGTINEVANGLAGRSDVIVAPTYGGSGCDLSRLFGIRKGIGKRIQEIYEKLHFGKQVKMLLSKVETNGHKRFFIGVGDAGFGAEVAGIFDRFRRFGKFGYVIGVILAIMKIKPLEVDIRIDGKPKVDKALMIMFARSMYYAGGMKVSPNSNPFSDSARMIYLRWMKKLKLLVVFPSVYSGNHLKISDVHESEVRRLQIFTPGLPIDVEGEFVGHTPCTFSVTDKYIYFV